MRDYETEESVDDDSPTLAAEASNARRQLFETVQRPEQNTELVNFREKRAESQQVEDKKRTQQDDRMRLQPRRPLSGTQPQSRAQRTTRTGCRKTLQTRRALRQRNALPRTGVTPPPPQHQQK